MKRTRRGFPPSSGHSLIQKTSPTIQLIQDKDCTMTLNKMFKSTFQIKTQAERLCAVSFSPRGRSKIEMSRVQKDKMTANFHLSWDFVKSSSSDVCRARRAPSPLQSDCELFL